MLTGETLPRFCGDTEQNVSPSMSNRIDFKTAARKLGTHPQTIARLVASAVLPEPSPAEPRGWDPEQFPAVVQALEVHKVAYRAAQLAGLEKAHTARRAQIAEQALSAAA